MKKRIEVLVEESGKRIEFAYEVDENVGNPDLLTEVSLSAACVDTFEENGEFVLVQLYFANIQGFTDWYNSVF